jgi:hypothetical protein
VAASGGPPALQDKEVVAMIAYLQRLGKDIRAAGITTTSPLSQATSSPSPPVALLDQPESAEAN